jgi:chemotaxis protein CheX
VISDDDLIQIAEDICLSLFAEGGAPAPAVDRDGPVATMTAVVDITGDWNASVSVSCERSTAVAIASVMFAAPGPELSNNDIIDALGEFANMAGGAVKGMFDGEKTLGLPVVEEGVDFALPNPGAIELSEADFTIISAGTLRIAVHEHIADRAAS